MSHRPRMPQQGSRKWCRISDHKSTHIYSRKDFGPFKKHWVWGYKWLNVHAADNPRWNP